MPSPANLQELTDTDDAIASLADTTAVSMLAPEAESDEAGSESAGPCCDKCGAAAGADGLVICPHCGWYASLNTFVEVDLAFEKASGAGAETATAEQLPQKSHFRVWYELVPPWGWVIIASVLGVVIESVLARFITPAGSSLRTTWSLTQLALGVLLAAGCHIFNFVVLAADDADFGVMDILLKPLKLWIHAARELPTRLWVANTAACGVTAATMSIVVIGGIPYERLWDWGFQEPVKQNLMSAVMDRARKLESRNESLEDSIKDFAGSQNLEADELNQPKPEKPRSKADCVILGYQLDREARLEALVLGTSLRGKLIYAGNVALTMPDDERAMLLQKLNALRTHDPFIRIEAEAKWVRPRLACRVTYVERQRSGRLVDVQWDRLLGELPSGARNRD
jgi:hypothetical protein